MEISGCRLRVRGRIRGFRVGEGVRVCRLCVCVNVCVCTGREGLFFDPFLHVPTDGRDVIAGEHARLAVARSLPPVGVGVV